MAGRTGSNAMGYAGSALGGTRGGRPGLPPATNPYSTASGAGSNKNTLINQQSKYTYTPYGANPTPAPLDPASYGAYATQVMGLQQNLAAAQALARAGIGAARAQFMTAADAARAQRISETAGAEAGALNSGIVGSSSDLANRATAISDAATARQAALAARTNAIAGIRSNQMQAVGQYYTGLGSAQANLAYQQEMANIERYKNDQFDVLQQNWKAYQNSAAARIRNRNRIRDGVGVGNSGGYSTGNPDLTASLAGGQPAPGSPQYQAQAGANAAQTFFNNFHF